MLSLPLLQDAHGARSPKVLLLGAHCDDIEIGCGATVAALVAAAPDATFRWVVFSSDEVRAAEARASASVFLSGASDAEVVVHTFRESHFPWQGSDLKAAMEAERAAFEPTVVFTHCLEDRHQDHRTVAELTHQTFRDHLVLEYEIPKYDGDLVPANVFVPTTREAVEHKCDTLLEHFASQRGRQWFDAETFRGLARLRGVECNAPDGYAEAFRCRKVVLRMSS